MPHANGLRVRGITTITTPTGVVNRLLYSGGTMNFEVFDHGRQRLEPETHSGIILILDDDILAGDVIWPRRLQIEVNGDNPRLSRPG